MANVSRLTVGACRLFLLVGLPPPSPPDPLGGPPEAPPGGPPEAPPGGPFSDSTQMSPVIVPDTKSELALMKLHISVWNSFWDKISSTSAKFRASSRASVGWNYIATKANYLVLFTLFSGPRNMYLKMVSLSAAVKSPIWSNQLVVTWLRLQIVKEGKKTSSRGSVLDSSEVVVPELR